ncbi:MAG: hypothetical protein HZB65_02770 [Candidatus Aenigmarchaeota archaeon]|nr:hypothetical protein [Candidatus Aenigmarchaeota archaeon]
MTQNKGLNKTVLAGISVILLGIVLFAAVFSGYLSEKPTGNLYAAPVQAIGIKEFMQNKPTTIFIDDTLSPENEEVVRELARAYNIDDIKVLTDDTINTSNAIVIAKRENNNIMAVKERIGLVAENDETLAKVDPDYNMLFIIGNEAALKDVVDILKNSQCSQLNSNAVIIKSGSGCAGIREQVLCSID